MLHCNIPVFIPHLGCPHHCVFCDQKKITGKALPACQREILRQARETIDACLATLSEKKAETFVEIAFFGGSFTAVSLSLQTALLALAGEYLRKNAVQGLRLSTRPDCLGEEVLDRLAAGGVNRIEIGVQSLSERVLAACGRGHTAADSLAAIRRCKARGFQVVGQMMTGLPLSTAEEEKECARLLCLAGVDGVRIYPTVVLADTPLAEAAKAGRYRPLSVEEAVCRCADLLEIFEEFGVPCLRIGLPASEELEGSVLGGGYHPALGEMARSLFYRRKIERLLAASPCRGGRVTLYVPVGRASAAAGYRKENRRFFARAFGCASLSIREAPFLRGETAAAVIRL